MAFITHIPRCAPIPVTRHDGEHVVERSGLATTLTDEWELPPEGPLGSPCPVCDERLNPGEWHALVWTDRRRCLSAHARCVEALPVRVRPVWAPLSPEPFPRTEYDTEVVF